MDTSNIIATLITLFFKDYSQPSLLIAIGGPGGSGKSSLCTLLQKQIENSSVLSLDNYRLPRKYRDTLKLYGSHPDANRLDVLMIDLETLRLGKSIQQPVYNKATGSVDSFTDFSPLRFILLDGEISMYKPIVNLCDFTLYLDADTTSLLERRISRDVNSYGYSHEKVVAVFEQSMCDNEIFGDEGRKRADISLYCKPDFRIEIAGFSERVCSKCGALVNHPRGPCGAFALS